jgi:AAA15 family ATPase/GTPase
MPHPGSALRRPGYKRLEARRRLTHDTNLLRSPFLRRDEVWFTEKDAEGATHLYPLTDFRTRKGDNLERGYLQGRYGAIPFAGGPSSTATCIHATTRR